MKVEVKIAISMKPLVVQYSFNQLPAQHFAMALAMAAADIIQHPTLPVPAPAPATFTSSISGTSKDPIGLTFGAQHPSTLTHDTTSQQNPILLALRHFLLQQSQQYEEAKQWGDTAMNTTVEDWLGPSKFSTL
jgi:hypothetical protein